MVPSVSPPRPLAAPAGGGRRSQGSVGAGRGRRFPRSHLSLSSRLYSLLFYSTLLLLSLTLILTYTFTYSNSHSLSLTLTPFRRRSPPMAPPLAYGNRHARVP